MRGRVLISIALLLALAMGLWWGLGGRERAITNAHPRGSAIIALGDSLTAGYGASPDEAYPAVLSRRLGVEVINAGVNGDTTQGALARLDRDVLARDPRVVIVCLGGNDLLRHVPREETLASLEQIVRRIQKQGALVILVGIKVVIGSSFAEQVEALAGKTGCEFVPDILGGIMGDRSLMHDEVHPNAAGYEKMADRIEPVLRRYAGAAAPAS